MVNTVGTAEAYGRAYRALTFLGERRLAEDTRRKGLALFPGDPNLRSPAEPRR
jgi:hypothetical protein